LTNEEICELILSGEINLLGQLVEQNRGIIHITARGYAGFLKITAAVDYDDLAQAAALGLILAVNKWDRERGSFLTIAQYFMTRTIRELLGINTSKQRIENARCVLPFDASIYPDEKESLALSETIPDENAVDPVAACEIHDIHERVRKAINALPPEIRKSIVLAYYYGNEWTQDKGERSRVLSGIARLKRNKDIKRLQREYRLTCYRHKGIKAFNTSWSSTVEDAVIRREKWRAEIERLRAETDELQERLNISKKRRN